MMRHQSRTSFVVLASILLAATLWIGKGEWQSVALAQVAKKAAPKTPLILDRAPTWVISDPNPVASGIAVDLRRDEVYITNDNEAADPSVAVYPTQFPPTDSVMEPRRRIAGPRAHLLLPCGVALSPESQEMFSVSGDGQDVTVFDMDAKGDVPPKRELQVPHAAGGVFMDVKNDELVLTIEHVNKILVYRRAAQGEDEPLRFIQGPHTGLADPHAIFVDTEKNEIFVTNHGNWRKTEPGEGFALRGDGKLARIRGSFSHPGIVEPLTPSTGKFLPASITVHSRTANGDVPPLRTIQGPHTRLNLPVGVYRDPVSGEVVVANSGDDSVLFFEANASGDAAPARVLEGKQTNLKGPTGVSIDPKHNELWVTNWDNHTTSVFPRTAQGNIAPLRFIRSARKDAPPATMGRFGGVGYDSIRKQILAPN